MQLALNPGIQLIFNSLYLKFWEIFLRLIQKYVVVIQNVIALERESKNLSKYKLNYNLKNIVGAATFKIIDM